MFKFGMGELLIIFLVVLMLFGAKRLPEIARALGKSIQEFKKAGKEITKEFDEEKQDNGKSV